MTRTWRAGAAAVAGVMLLLACGAHGDRWPAVLSPVPAPPPDSVVLRLYLIGDAGAPHRGFEPVLVALESDIAAAPERSVAVFLGDNIYERGLLDSAARDRAESERRLDRQVAVAHNTGARVFFAPGNHDWAKDGPDGWAAMRRQTRFVEQRGEGRAVLLPADGCPGPEVVDLAQTLRLVLIDTQWWLHPGPKPVGPDSPCGVKTEGQWVDSLRGALRDAGAMPSVVVAHHPLESGGPHGGKFGWKDHVFPLRNLSKVLWVPLPIVGSIYPLSRQLGAARQDLPSAPYKILRDSLRSAFAPTPPLAYAAGHDHNLQVIEWQPDRYLLVSGSGIYDHVRPAHDIEGTHFAAAESGFMRLDVLPDGRVRLSVLVVDATGGAVEAYARWLR